MQKLSADIIYPQTAPPIKNGILILDNKGTIMDVIDPTNCDYTINDVLHISGALCPGFINTHCHLELSYMHHTIEKHAGMASFIKQVEEKKKTHASIVKIDAAFKAEQLMKENGIVAVGDIVNTSDSLSVKEQSSLYFHNFVEVYGSNPALTDTRFEQALALYNQFRKQHKASIVPHAVYSVSQQLFDLITTHAAMTNSIQSIHHAESLDETQFFLTGNGPIADMLTQFGTDINTYKPFDKSAFNYLEEHYLPVPNNLLLVHNTYFELSSISKLISRQAHQQMNKLFFVLCPNSNLFIENKLPDFTTLSTSTDNICLGTDSLASNTTLSIMEELKTIRHHVPQIPIETLLSWATINGARSLGIDDRFGSFEKGKHPGIVNIDADLNIIQCINM